MSGMLFDNSGQKARIPEDLKGYARQGQPTQQFAVFSKRGGFGRTARKMYDFLCEQKENGATDEEISTALNIPRSSVCSSRNRLIELGLVKGSGNMRMGSYGIPNKVWVAMK